jgi:ATP-dependent helicase/nuclease subunit B
MPVVDGLCEELAASRFEPRFFELALTRSGMGPAPISLENDGGVVSIYGIIDRVDAYKRGDDVYLRVIDYKTGHKEFSPDDMEQGANLQMFLYLKSLVESESVAFRDQLGLQGEGRLIPAGVIYVKTAVGDVRVDTPDDLAAEAAVKGAQGREGMILDDPDVISAMNVKYTPLYSSRTPDKIPESKRKFLYDEDGWAQIMETVEGSVLRVADEIRSGEMPATPRWQNGGKSACEYCPYKPVCRKVEK